MCNISKIIIGHWKKKSYFKEYNFLIFLFWWHHTTNWYFKRQTSRRLKKARETVFMASHKHSSCSLRNIHTNVTRRASPGRLGCAHARSWGTKNEFILPKSGLKCSIVPTNHITGFWKLHSLKYDFFSMSHNYFRNVAHVIFVL
jgi:hypothetical protein